MGGLILEGASRLDAFSAYPVRTWSPSCATGVTTGAPSVRPPGPLVLGAALLKPPAPTTDRDRTVSRRSEPSSRTALMGEQPNPWNRLQLQDAMSRHRGAKPPRRCELLGRSACYPQGSFYPLSDGPSIRIRRITKPDFRPCSTCMSRSQTPLCLCTLCMVSIHAEGIFGRLRYSLGGDRPSQTARLTLSVARCLG